MKLPVKIDKLIDRRARLAYSLNSADYELGKWLDKNGVEGIEECDYCGGCEMYANPDAAAMRIRKAILDH